jgi:ABC-type glycerol-3-phosphate transport system permease component
MRRVQTALPEHELDARILPRFAGKRAWQFLKKTIILVILSAGAFLIMIPFAWMISTSLKEPDQIFLFPPKWIPDPIRWQNYPEVLTLPDYPFHLFFRNTAFITFSCMVGQLLGASLVGFSFARVRWTGRNVLFVFVLSTMMLPPQVTMIPKFIIFYKLGWIDTFAPLIVPILFGGVPFTIFLMRQFFMTIPLELDDAARIDGCGILGIYWHIILPLSRPVMATVAIFTVLWNWNDFLDPLIYLNSRENFTLAVALSLLRYSPYGSIRWHYLMAASLMVVAPIIILFFFAQRQFVQGIVFTGVKG